jgi:hypothetical protein
MAGGIGDFSVTAGKDLSGNSGSFSERDRSSIRSTSPMDVSGPAYVPGSGNAHYIVIMKKSWEQAAPLKFHNGLLEDLKSRLKLVAKVPLPDMPHFFPQGSEGEIAFEGRHVLHVDSALREQPLFSHLETLKELVQRCVDRKVTFPEFVKSLNKIPIPATWRNDIVNGLFENAQDPGPFVPPVPKTPGLSQDLDKLMGLLNEKDTGGSRLSPQLGHFLDEVGRDSTGFTLRNGAATELHKDLTQTLAALRGSLLRQASLAETLGFIASLQRLAKSAKGRERQLIHLWSEIPEDPTSLLVGENADAAGDFAVALVLIDPWERSPAFLSQVANLAAQLKCPLLIQASGDGLSSSTAFPEGESLEALKAFVSKPQAFFFSGGVASRVDDEACVFRPAVLAFLEGLVSSKENVAFYLHHAMHLEDQDLITEKGQARSTDRLLDQTQINALSLAKINRVNGARNQSIASFPLLTPWGNE